jgi:hypothetical protein
MYKKLIETKVIKIQHQVSFCINTIAYSILEDLKKVPTKAKLTEVDEESNTLTFEEEIKERK